MQEYIVYMGAKPPGDFSAYDTHTNILQVIFGRFIYSLSLSLSLVFLSALVLKCILRPRHIQFLFAALYSNILLERVCSVYFNFLSKHKMFVFLAYFCITYF